MESSDQTLQQLMFSLIEVWKTSGQTQLDFCREKDIAYHKFHYWFRKYSKQNSCSPENPSSFARILVKNQNAMSSASVELVYPDGRRLIFNGHVDATFLRNLLA